MKKNFLPIIIVVLALMAGFALAFHPGQNKNGDVPQGPHQTACDNQGRQGIDVAIANGGMVHCEECVEVDPREISFGACTDISLIEELGLSQCCGIKGPQGGINCGAEEEWVVGIAAVPTCYIPGS
ncbi:MAG: hypothetical protein COT59_01915 [Candidatus Nealsonbacteria bacterium CG09_land_8_20_14_0_10_42_14]|uniref:Uncharacterized protein n=1 Tax=Candidatus Nealsonbacteria bacterium CG09_land_8_20_14_0_10_42_14 TaxID=1974707 RepID=A0A2H0WX26_9BACT|nr:MAG: hypothetical protein COT59_01915 [Candidatus Nealsonbacteria bacterium CG09_land_8_20_14_0_10_42_14]